MIDQNIIIERLRFYADSFYGLPGTPQLLRLTEGQAELLAVDIRKMCNELERLNTRVQELSWQGQVDHMSGAFDPNDRHEMGG